MHEGPARSLRLRPKTLRTAATTRQVKKISEQAISPRSGRIERPAARGGGGEWSAGIAPGCCRRTRWWCHHASLLPPSQPARWLEAQLPARVSKRPAGLRSSRVERRAARGGPAERRWRRGGRVVEAGRESSRSGLGALKSTGSRRHVPRSATLARAPSHQDVSRQLQPAPAPDLGRYRQAAPASPAIRRRHFVSPEEIHNHC